MVPVRVKKLCRKTVLKNFHILLRKLETIFSVSFWHFFERLPFDRRDLGERIGLQMLMTTSVMILANIFAFLFSLSNFDSLAFIV